MNTYEAERIADAMNRLRPDWPLAQLKTLLKDDRLAGRPRRDVCVALAWVACESGTSNPYRVIEAGPWWRAAGIEGATTMSAGPTPPPEERCSICSQHHDKCRSLWADDHEFESAVDAARNKTGRPVSAVEAIVDDLHEEVAEDVTPTPEPREKPQPADPRAEAARAAMRAADTEPTDTEDVA